MTAPLHPLYSCGYQGHQVEALRQQAERLDAIVADVRLKPFSRDPAWRRGPLERVLGARYVWIEALGNLNYRGPGPVLLKDAEAGLAVLREFLSQRPVILLCVCASPVACHRTVVANAIAAEGWPVLPLSLTAAVRVPAPSLF